MSGNNRRACSTARSFRAVGEAFSSGAIAAPVSQSTVSSRCQPSSPATVGGSSRRSAAIMLTAQRIASSVTPARAESTTSIARQSCRLLSPLAAALGSMATAICPTTRYSAFSRRSQSVPKCSKTPPGGSRNEATSSPSWSRVSSR